MFSSASNYLNLIRFFKVLTVPCKKLFKASLNGHAHHSPKAPFLCFSPMVSETVSVLVHLQSEITRIAWGLTMAAYSKNLSLKRYIYLLLKFLAWSFIARSLACAINDICDHKYDGKVGLSCLFFNVCCK